MMDGPPISLDEPTFSEEPTVSSTKPKRRGRPSMMSIDEIQTGSSDKIPRPSSAEAPKAHFRGWVPSSKYQDQRHFQPASFDKRSLRVLSYNVLASRYVSTDKYRFCPTWALSEPYRCGNMLAEITAAKPDLIFFQELSSDLHKSTIFGEKLRKEHDYDSFHVPISNKQGKSHAAASSGSGVADSMGSNGSYTIENQAPRVVRVSGQSGGVVGASGGGLEAGALNSNEFSASGGIPIAEDCTRPEFEGVALFFNKSRFELQEHLPVKYNILAQNDQQLQIAERNRLVISSHNVAVVSVLLDKITGDAVICAGTHAFWDWSRPECQHWQMMRMIKEVETLESAYSEMGYCTRVILAGDFNSERNSVCVQYALQQRIPPAFPPSVSFPGYRDVSHSLLLHNSYEEYCALNPNFVTSTGPSFSGVIDYIFADRTYDVLAVAALDVGIEMPQPTVPSDHYPVAAILLPMEPAE